MVGRQENLRAQTAKEGQRELIEETPAFREEAIEEVMILSDGNDIAEQSKQPVARVHLDLYLPEAHVLEKFSQVLHLEELKELVVFEHTRNFGLIYISHLVVFYQRNK